MNRYLEDAYMWNPHLKETLDAATTKVARNKAITAIKKELTNNVVPKAVIAQITNQLREEI